MEEQQSLIIIEDEMLREGFTQIPNIILRDPNIPFGAKVAYGVLLSYAWQKGSCFPGQETMAADMGVTDRSVRTYLDQLAELNLISIKQNGFGKTNTYTILSTARRNILPIKSGSVLPVKSGSHVPVRTGSLLPTNKTQVEKTQIKKTHSPSYSPIDQTSSPREGEERGRDGKSSQTATQSHQPPSRKVTNAYVTALGKVFHAGKTPEQLTDPAWEELTNVAKQLERTGDAPEEIAIRAARWNTHYPNAGAITKNALLKHWSMLANDPPPKPADRNDRSRWEMNGCVYAREEEDGSRSWPPNYRPSQADINMGKIIGKDGKMKSVWVG